MLSDRIRTRRKILGISQKQLAEISGIGQSSISRYEKDDGGITLTYLLKLAEVLECSPLYLVEEEFGIPTNTEHRSAISPKEIAALRTHAKEILAIIGE
ncbi:hypothetical protein SDC9_104366 [bioreactor metagenome]|uniref:HTH cro/C1-type domain-containing protein n=1 Tax=bioreactor metagenome TaxID=1076179 RepID=A0A645B763_9ZZZZ|nr:helix-turn-helix domain-containing protein [Cloacibacillus evryensis]MEA5034220.1 helix-turn-helix domain-containing protein [Cloacibacillus evryensis]